MDTIMISNLQCTTPEDIESDPAATQCVSQQPGTSETNFLLNLPPQAVIPQTDTARDATPPPASLRPLNKVCKFVSMKGLHRSAGMPIPLLQRRNSTLLVNYKQQSRILKRRIERTADDEPKPHAHLLRQQHAIERQRAPGGQFISSRYNKSNNNDHASIYEVSSSLR